MNNKLICNNCQASNPVYSLNCEKCNSFLRARVPNIDLWDTVWNLLISPVETAIKLIQAEQKNFIVFLLSVWFVKATINQYILNNYFQHDNNTFISSFINGGLLSVTLLVLFSFIISLVFNTLKIPTRFKDVLAVYTYSLIPILLVFLFLTPFHFALYGFYWFTINPPPLVIKPLVTFVLYGIEGLFYIWVLFLFVAVTYAQSGRKPLSFIVGLSLFLILFGYYLLMV